MKVSDGFASMIKKLKEENLREVQTDIRRLICSPLRLAESTQALN